MSKHTKGPWVVTGQETEKYTATIRHIDSEKGSRKELWVADATKQDAQLIAAAPDLLRIVQCVLELLDENGLPGNAINQWRAGGPNIALGAIWSESRKAIAKATGQKEGE